MATIITDVSARDIRFPTSLYHIGSDAMNPDPDYSAAYVVIRTSTGMEGHGLTFTIGRGNELCVAAVEALRPLVMGQALESITSNLVYGSAERLLLLWWATESISGAGSAYG